MAGASLLTLLDDIASVLDDVALLTKVAARKTAGVLGDDLALNAQQVAGVRAERELPVVWGVAKGSLVNKLILIPAALFLSTLAPALIAPLLMIGGLYLCFEGAEKLFHRFFQAGEKEERPEPEPGADPDVAALEKLKIKGAIRTDFVLSAEIIVIALGTVPAEASFGVRAGVLGLIGLAMTIGVYGLVAGLVKLDDVGLRLMGPDRSGSCPRLGALLVGAAPVLMRILAVAGTAAMFLVGGGILVHGLPFLRPVTGALADLPLGGLVTALAQALFGLLAGAASLVLLRLPTLRRRRRGH